MRHPLWDLESATPDRKAHGSAPAAPAREAAVSLRRRLRSALVRLTWACTVAAMLLLAFSYLLPQDLRRTGRLYTPAVALAFYGRTFTFHTGLALLAAA